MFHPGAIDDLGDGLLPPAIVCDPGELYFGGHASALLRPRVLRFGNELVRICRRDMEDVGVGQSAVKFFRVRRRNVPYTGPFTEASQHP